jgi:hypothetical protein
LKSSPVPGKQTTDELINSVKTITETRKKQPNKNKFSIKNTGLPKQQ